MNTLHILRPSFAGGEADPALAARSDLAKFNTFLKKCRNFFIHPQGGASNRPGTFFLASTKNPDKKSRLIPFEFSTTNCYVMEFGAGYIRFFTDSGVVLDANGLPYEVSTVYQETDLQKIHWAQSADVVYLACEGHPPKMLTRFGHANWTFEDYPYKNGPYLPHDGEAKGHLVQTDATGDITALAVDYSNNIYATQNGKQWTMSPKLSSAKQDIWHANGLFFKQEDGVLYSSQDSRVWNRRAALEDTLTNVVFGNGFYVAFGTKKVFYSADLNDWNECFDLEDGITETWRFKIAKVSAFLNGLFILYAQGQDGQNGYQSYIFTAQTPAAGNWTQTYGKYWGISFEKIYYQSGRYLITPGFSYSTDLRTFQNPGGATVNLPSYFQPGGNNLLVGVIAGNSGSFITASLDNGDTWQRFGKSPSTFGGAYSALGPFSSDYADGMFYFAGESGNYYCVIRGNITEGFSEVMRVQTVRLKVRCVPVSAAPAADKLVSNNYKFEGSVFGRKYKISKEFQSASISKSFGSASTEHSDTILAGGGWIFQTSGTWSGQVDIETSKDNINWSSYRSFSSTNGNSNYNVSGNFDGTLYFVRITAHLTGINQVAHVSFSAYSFTAYVYLSGVGRESSNTILVQCDQDTEYIKNYIDEKEGDLYVGSWSEAGGWPSTVCIYQGRVCWGKDFTIDATKVEEYTNFGVSIPLTDSDAVSTNVRAGGLNAIQHLVAGNRLLAFTSGGEFASNSDVFTPSSCGMTKQTNRGASLPSPVIIGQRIIYAQAMGTVLRDFSYNFEADGYDGDDLCVLSRHLFAGRKICEIAYQQEPDSLLWVLLNDGTLLCCTYMREQEVLAWSQMETDGLVESICTIPGKNQNDLYLAVNREGKRFVERMAPRLPSFRPEDQVFLDSCVTYSGEDTCEVGGLEHLEGKTVGVLGDGAVIAKKVVTDGKITITRPHKVLTVGLPYLAELETMPVDAQLEDGTMQDRKSRPCKMFLSVANTVGAFVGQTGQELEEIIFREWAEGYNKPIPLKTGTYEVSLGSFSQYNPTVTVQKRTPLPITVIGLVVQQRV